MLVKCAAVNWFKEIVCRKKCQAMWPLADKLNNEQNLE